MSVALDMVVGLIILIFAIIIKQLVLKSGVMFCKSSNVKVGKLSYQRL